MDRRRISAWQGLTRRWVEVGRWRTGSTVSVGQGPDLVDHYWMNNGKQSRMESEEVEMEGWYLHGRRQMGGEGR